MLTKRNFRLGLFAILLIILCYIPWFFSSLLLLPKTNCSKEHHVFCDTPKEIGLEYETVSIINADGISLESRYIPAQNSKKGIIMGMEVHAMRVCALLLLFTILALIYLH